MRTIARTLLAATAALAIVPAGASAEEIEIGQKVPGPGSACKGNNAVNDSVKVCFQPGGEWLYVKDKDADGRSAFGEIANRDRRCRNPYGKGTWVRCNYSYPDGHTVTFRGYTRDNEGAINIMRNETRYTSDLA